MKKPKQKKKKQNVVSNAPLNNDQPRKANLRKRVLPNEDKNENKEVDGNSNDNQTTVRRSPRKRQKTNSVSEQKNSNNNEANNGNRNLNETNNNNNENIKNDEENAVLPKKKEGVNESMMKQKMLSMKMKITKVVKSKIEKNKNNNDNDNNNNNKNNNDDDNKENISPSHQRLTRSNRKKIASIITIRMMIPIITKPKKKVVILLTGVQYEKETKTLRELGATVLQDYSNDVTHLVSSIPRRTLKFICGISCAKYIVTEQWIKDCCSKKNIRY